MARNRTGETIGVGVVGLSARGNWGAVAHQPAIEAVPGVELRGLTARTPESTAAASAHFGVPGYGSVAELAARGEIDLIAITVRVPEHRALLEPALESGKAVLCEWPLALDVAEAELLRDAGRPSPRFAGLQGHVSPTLSWIRDLVADGYVGDVLSSSMVASFPGGGPAFTAGSAYTADVANGATLITIPFAHALDMQAVVLGGLSDPRATVATLLTEGLNLDTGETIPKTAPDQIAVSGRLAGGAVANLHFRGAAHRTTPMLWEIDGTAGSLRITADVGLPMSAPLAVEGAHGDGVLAPLQQPGHYDRFPALAGTPAHNVAHLYDHVVRALGGHAHEAPAFDDAVQLHRVLETITAAAAR